MSPNLIDVLVTEDHSGIWALAPSPGYPAAWIVLVVVLALRFGVRRRFGRTMWRSVDAAVLAGLVTRALKLFFQRPRPVQNDHPDIWFAGPGHVSFPSGDVLAVAAVVTPVILDWAGEYPAVWSLLALPAFDMAARVKYHAHWPTDVVAGAMLGALVGWGTSCKRSPLIARLVPVRLAAGVGRSPGTKARKVL